MLKKHFSYAVAIAIAISLVTASAFADSGEGGGTEAEKGAAFVVTAPIQEKTLTETITAYGTVQSDPAQIHNIAMPREGIIINVFVRPGQIVKTGDPVIEFETSPGSTAQYDQAKAAVQYAAKTLERNKSLLKEQLATRSQVAQSEKDLADTKTELDKLVKSGANQPHQTLPASFDGVVTSVTAIPGDRLQADALTATIGSRNALVVALGIEPEDASRIVVGADVTLTSPLNPAINVKDKISAVHGMVNPTTRLVDALVQLSPPDTDNLVQGMTLVGHINLTPWKGPAIPSAAIMEGESGFYIFTVKDGTAKKTSVGVALETDNEAGLKDTLAEGTRVVISGNALLSDGMAVREKPEDKPKAKP